MNREATEEPTDAINWLEWGGSFYSTRRRRNKAAAHIWLVASGHTSQADALEECAGREVGVAAEMMAHDWGQMDADEALAAIKDALDDIRERLRTK